MEQLIFVCPTTGQKVDSGIESDLDTFARISDQSVRVHCPACGAWHEWPVRDALPAAA